MTEYNLKAQEFYCPKCKKYHTLTAVNPSCPDCNRTMYVVLYSIVDNTRITGNDELAPADYRAAPRTRKS